MSKNNLSEQFTIRVNKRLSRRIREDAKANRRKLSDYLRILLMDAVGEEKPRISNALQSDVQAESAISSVEPVFDTLVSGK